MKTKIFIAFLLLMTACGKDGGPYRVIAFGDSITEGNYGGGYIKQVAAKRSWDLNNQAEGGSLMWRQLSAVRISDLSPYKAIVWMGGFNDARLHGLDPAALDDFREDLTKAVEMFRNAGCEVYIGTPMRMIDEAYPLYSPMDQASAAAIDAYADVIRDVVETEGNEHFHIIDVNRLYTPSRSAVVGDLVHPNAAGNAQLIEIFAKQIEEIEKPLR